MRMGIKKSIVHFMEIITKENMVNMTNKTKYVLPFIIIMLAVLVIYMFISLSNSCFYLNCGGSLDYGEVGGICCVYETVFENPKNTRINKQINVSI